MRALLKHQNTSIFRRTKVLSDRYPEVVVTLQDKQQLRCMHESYLPKGRGGRSSFSGIVATVFGATGFLGPIVMNHLGVSGASVLMPHRGTFERAYRMKLMGDLGQIIPREEFSMKQDDDVIRELIKHSNCVINMIKTRTPLNHYSMEKVNIEWPVRLAKLVAEKNDGTRLIHITHLNCHQEEGRKVSNLLQQDFEAEEAIKEIYPATTIVRCANLHGYYDHYVHLLLSSRFSQIALTGACPVLYDAGHSTVIQPLYVSDAAEGITRLAKHPDAMGHTFEFVGPSRFTLHDFCQYLLDLNQRDYYDFNTIGPMDRSKATTLQKAFHLVLDFHFWRMFQPRFRPRFLDLITRTGSSAGAWMTFDHYKMLHITDRTTGAPGLHELGIEPAEIEEKISEFGLQLPKLEEDWCNRSVPRVEPEKQTMKTGGVPQLIN